MEMASIKSRINGFSATIAAMRAEGVPAHCRPVLAAICGHINGVAECFPALATLAKESGCHRNSVIRAVNVLVKSGHVVRLGVKHPGGPQVYRVNLEKLGLAPVASAAQPQPVETADTAETKAVPAPAPAQARRQDSAAQVLTRVLEALDALTRRVEAVERTLARMAERQGIPAEAPTPVAPAPKSAEGKAKRPEQLPLFPEGGNTPEAEQKPAWDIEDGWKRFWDAWPDHRGKKPARVAFGKVMAKQKDPEAHLQLMLSVIARKKTERSWREGIYMLPATFLNDERWEDEPEKERAGSGGSGGSSNRHGQKLPVSDKEVEEYTIRMMGGRVPEDEDEDQDESGAPEAKEQGSAEKEGGEGCAGVDPEEGLTPEQLEWLNDHPDWR